MQDDAAPRPPSVRLRARRPRRPRRHAVARGPAEKRACDGGGDSGRDEDEDEEPEPEDSPPSDLPPPLLAPRSPQTLALVVGGHRTASAATVAWHADGSAFACGAAMARARTRGQTRRYRVGSTAPS